MILSAQTIRALRPVEPFVERSVVRGRSYGLSVAGYDIRICETLYLAPGAFSLASSIEHFDMPADVLALVKDKSSWARKGLSVFNTVIEPGWKGYLTLELKNQGDQVLRIDSGDPIAQILFYRLDAPSEAPYSGKYQNQEAGPQGARLEGEA
ncbi:dCTP deaminase [Hyphomicrobium sp. 99]|uniref:dCTP deaminase n=1 Tax=Hyphomicrobium sp. 99 TaxID=1163419 RepID=UPI0005F8689D|nr:dCTP deaminase [Hyphomicrobium sp. 99]